MIDKFETDERGMTGIGVLILFIALVLVAAIASGLILDTAGMLQNTAQDTGEQSTSEVSDRLSVLSSSGDVVQDSNGVNWVANLSMTVYRSPGAGDVDLQNATVEFFGPDGTAFLVHEDEYDDAASEIGNSFAGNLGFFQVEAVKDNDASVPVLNSRDDRAALVVPLENHDTGTTWTAPTTTDGGEAQTGDFSRLAEGDSATLRLTTQSGATTTEIVNVPQSLAGYDGSTVML